MAITLIHNPACVTDGSGAATTLDVSPGGAVAVGDLIVVGAAHRDEVGGTMTCTDSQSNSYTRIGMTPPDTDHSRQVFWTIATAASTPTITLTCSGAAQLGGFSVVYRGTHQTTPIYAFAESVSGSWTTSWSQIAGGAVASGDVAFGVWISAYGVGSAGASAPNSHFQYEFDTGLMAIAHEDAVPWGGGTPSAEFSNDSTQIGAGTACFGIAVAGAGNATASAIARAVTTVRGTAIASTPGVAVALTRAVTTFRGVASASSGGGGSGGTITITGRGHTNASAAASLNSGDFTPANGSMLVAIGYLHDATLSGRTVVFSDNYVDTGGGAWTEIVTVGGPLASGITAHLRAFYRKIGTSPGSGHVTIACTPTGSVEFQMSVAELGGVYLPTPVPSGQTAALSGILATLAPALPATPASDSIAFAACLDLDGVASPATPTNYTSLGSGIPYGDGFRTAYDNASASPVASFSSLHTAAQNLAIVFEIASSPSVGVPGFSISDTFGDSGGGVWTTARTLNASGAEVMIAYRRIGANPVSGTVTATAAVSTEGREMSVLELGNRNPDNPVPPTQTASVSTAAASASMTLPATPSTDSIVVAGLISRGHATAPGTPTGHTSVANVSTGGDGYQASYDGANALAVVAYTGLATTRNLGAMAEFRKLSTGTGGGGGQYFSPSSSWNTKIPANATYVDEPVIRSGQWWLNAGDFGVPFVKASASDPIMTVSTRDGRDSWGWPPTSPGFHCPTTGFGANGSDKTMIVLDVPDAQGITWAYDFWIFERTSDTTGLCSAWARGDAINGDGWGTNPPFLAEGIHAHGGASLAGLTLGDDLKLGYNHALGLLFSQWVIQPFPNMVGQAISSDGTGGPLRYSERFGIPPNVPMPAVIVSTAGRNIWKGMQEYGGFLVDAQHGDRVGSIVCDTLSVDPADLDALLNPPTYQTHELNAIAAATRIVR